MQWRRGLPVELRARVASCYELLAAQGPQLGRPLVDRIKGSKFHSLKELRISGEQGAKIRILFIFDLNRQAILLTAGDKKGEWGDWYPKQIQLAEERYLQYLKAAGQSGT